MEEMGLNEEGSVVSENTRHKVLWKTKKKSGLGSEAEN